MYRTSYNSKNMACAILNQMVLTSSVHTCLLCYLKSYIACGQLPYSSNVSQISEKHADQCITQLLHNVPRSFHNILQCSVCFHRVLHLFPFLEGWVINMRSFLSRLTKQGQVLMSYLMPFPDVLYTYWCLFFTISWHLLAFLAYCTIMYQSILMHDTGASSSLLAVCWSWVL